jgi:hypothetical protein
LFNVMATLPEAALTTDPWSSKCPVGTGADAEAFMVKVALPFGPIMDGLMVAVTPGGRMLSGTDSVAWPVYPRTGCILIVVVAVPPGCRSTNVGLAESVKPTKLVIEVRLSRVVALRPPLVPVTTIFVVITEP